MFDSTYLTAEARARVEIDRQLAACGWLVQDRSAMNLFAGQGTPPTCQHPACSPPKSSRSSKPPWPSSLNLRRISRSRGRRSLSLIDIGEGRELNVFEIDGNAEANRQTPMFGRCRLDHVGLEAASLEAFEKIGGA